MTDQRTATMFPTQPGEITPDWLTEQLRAADAIAAGQRIVGLHASPVGEGAGMLGVLARMDLDYDGEPGPVGSVIVKCATPTEANRAIAMTFRMYEREVRFFRDLAARVSEGIPACYAAEIDLGTGDHVLVLEDLAGYRLGDQGAGCGLADAELGVDVMARLHAAWWGAHERAELDWVPHVDGELHKGGMAPTTRATWEPFLANFGHLVPPAIVEAGPRYLASLEELHDRMGRGPQTLVHGDFRLDNLLFGEGPDDRPLVLVDWQGVLVSKGIHDLAYLLTQNLHTDERRAHERTLVERYHGRLAEAGVQGYAVDEAWDDYRLAALWLFEYGIVIGGGLDPANERGQAFMTGLIERSVTTITDLDLLALLP